METVEAGGSVSDTKGAGFTLSTFQGRAYLRSSVPAIPKGRSSYQWPSFKQKGMPEILGSIAQIMISVNQ